MPLTFHSISSSREERHARRSELEHREVERGLTAYLLRTAVLAFSVLAFMMSSLTLWRSARAGSFRPSWIWIVGSVLFWLAFALWAAFWEFRRKQKCMQMSSADATR